MLSMMVGERRPNLPKVRLFHSGGEAVTQDLVDCVGHGRLFLNVYGSTKRCSNCLIVFCTPGDRCCTIGMALPYIKAYILESPESGVEAPLEILTTALDSDFSLFNLVVPAQ